MIVIISYIDSSECYQHQIWLQKCHETEIGVPSNTYFIRWMICFRVITQGWRRAKNRLPCPRGSCTRCRYKVYEMNVKYSWYPGDRDEGVDREALLQDRSDREGFGQEGHGGGRKVKWPNSFFDFVSILLAHICYILKCPKKPSWQKLQLINWTQWWYNREQLESELDTLKQILEESEVSTAHPNKQASSSTSFESRLKSYFVRIGFRGLTGPNNPNFESTIISITIHTMCVPIIWRLSC